MDKNTLSNYGWIVIAVLVLSVMIALATPFGTYVKDATVNTLDGLIDVSDNALGVINLSSSNNANTNEKDDVFPISWNSMGVMGNTSCEWDGASWVKISDNIPNNEEIAKTAIRFSYDGEDIVASYAGIQSFDGLSYVFYEDRRMEGFIVSVAGEYAEFGVTIPETGFYVLDVGSFGVDIDFVIDYACQHKNTRIENIAPTCKETGIEGMEICTSCGKIVVAGSLVPVSQNHIWNTDDRCSECNAYKIPEGATLVKTNGTVYSEGDAFPTFENGDIYTYGDYKYQYYVRTEMMGPMTITKTAIGVSVIDKSKTSYGEILSSIAGKPVTEMSGTFMNCTALKVAPAIPNSIKIMPSAFSGCTSLTTAPVIPSGITSLYMTFKDCTSLTGTIEVNVTSSLSANLAMTENSCGACFYGVNFETQNLKLTGSASDSLLDAMGTQSNTYKYCRICNGICSYGKINDSSVHQ